MVKFWSFKHYGNLGYYGSVLVYLDVRKVSDMSGRYHMVPGRCLEGVIWCQKCDIKVSDGLRKVSDGLGKRSSGLKRCQIVK